ncbi:MAG: PAS domain-containing sensor histidine kinase [Chromatiales bacterium]|nr:PAS domain-containing sensor histidine kinase [Chromatiales bacterium]
MPEPYQSQHDRYLAHYVETGERRMIGIGREVTGRRADGGTFPVELSVSETWLGDRRLFTGVVRDITERKKMERLKNEFVSTVSHELRTPLTSIRGSLGLVAGGVAGPVPDKARELLDIAYKNSERLTNLINDILDIERIESGKMKFELRRHDLMPLVEQSIDANRGYANSYGVSYRLAAALPGARVLVDPDRLMQVLANLLSNAAKFSPAGGTVDVSVAMHGKRMRVAVADCGPGVPPEFRAHIFGKFSQADASDTRAKGGSGLGLSISKAIVERMSGAIGFESVAGQGSTFWFDLPVAADAPVIARRGRAVPPTGAGVRGRPGRGAAHRDGADRGWIYGRCRARCRQRPGHAGGAALCRDDARCRSSRPGRRWRWCRSCAPSRDPPVADRDRVRPGARRPDGTERRRTR